MDADSYSKRVKERKEKKVRSGYPSNVSDEEWALLAPYLCLMAEEAPQRAYSLREVFNALRWIVRAGASWRIMPNAICLPGRSSTSKRSVGWLPEYFLTLVDALRAVTRIASGRSEKPTAAIFDSRTVQSTRESGSHAGAEESGRLRVRRVEFVAGAEDLEAPGPAGIVSDRRGQPPRLRCEREGLVDAPVEHRGCLQIETVHTLDVGFLQRLFFHDLNEVLRMPDERDGLAHGPHLARVSDAAACGGASKRRHDMGGRP